MVRTKGKQDVTFETFPGKSEISRKWETWKSDGVGNVFWLKPFNWEEEKERSNRGLEGITHGDRWWIRQEQSLGREEEAEESAGFHVHTHRVGEQKGAQGGLVHKVQLSLISETSHGQGSPAVKSPSQTQLGQTDPQKRLVQCFVNQEPWLHGMPKLVPTLSPAGNHSSSQCWTKNQPTLSCSPNKSTVGKVWTLSLRTLREFSRVQRTKT